MPPTPNGKNDPNSGFRSSGERLFGDLSTNVELTEAGTLASANVSPTPIGIQTPLRLSADVGPGTVVSGPQEVFSMHFDAGDQVSDNLRNLIKTNHGERLGQPDFGANIRPLLFEMTPEVDFEAEVMQRIKTATAKHMPFVNLVSFEVAIDNRQTSPGLATLGFTIGFDVPDLDIINRKINVLVTTGG